MRTRLVAIALLASLTAGVLPAPPAGAAVTDQGWGVPTPLQRGFEGDIYNAELALSAATGDTFALWYQEEGVASEGLYAAHWSPSWNWPNWDTPFRLGAEGYAGNLAADTNGNALAIYSQYDATGDALTSSRFTPAGGWGAPVTIESTPGYGYGADLAMDSTGRATAAWVVGNDTGTAVWAARYASVPGWSAPELLASTPYDVSDVRVAVDGSGNAVALWRQSDGGSVNDLWASRFAASAWSPPARIEAGAGTVNAARVALGDSGSGLAVFAQASSGVSHVFAANFSPLGGWETPVQLEALTNSVYSVELGMNAAGLAMAIWPQHSSGDGTSAFAARFVPGVGWEAPTQLESSTEGVLNPNVAVDSAGNALALWRQSDGNQVRLYQNYYLADNYWCCPYAIDYAPGGGEPLYSPRIVFDAADNAVAAWVQFDGAFNSLYASHYTASSQSWYNTLVEYDHDQTASGVRVATNAAGAAAVAWYQRDSYLIYNLYANTYAPGVGWALPTLLEKLPYSAFNPSVAVDAAGNVAVLWTQSDGANTNAYAVRYTAGGGWTSPTMLDSIAGVASSTRLGADDAGNVIALWMQHDGTNYSLYSSRFTPAGGWGSAALVEDTTGGVSGIQLGVRPSGEGMALWYQWDGAVYRIRSASFTPGSGWGAPTDVEPTGGDSPTLDFALNPSGWAAASWTRSRGVSTEFHAAVFDPARGWGSSTQLADSSKSIIGGVVTIDGLGNAFAAWGEYEGAVRRLHVARWTQAHGWGDDQTLAAPGLGDFYPTDLVADSTGNAFVAGLQGEGARNSAAASRYLEGAGWRTPQLLESGLADARAASLAIDGAGNALAAWVQSDGRHYLPWASWYLVGDGSPSLVITQPTASVVGGLQVTVSGRTNPTATVTVAGTSAPVDATGSFSVLVPLTEGANVVEVLATSAGGVSTRASISIRADTTAPALALSSPTNGATVESPTVTVVGTTEPGASVSVSGVAASVSLTGAFEVTLALEPGSNAVEVTAWDAAGNRASASVNVTWNDPTAQLRQQLDATEAKAAAASGAATLAMALGGLGLAAGAVAALLALRGGRRPPKVEVAGPPAATAPQPAVAGPPSPPASETPPTGAPPPG